MHRYYVHRDDHFISNGRGREIDLGDSIDRTQPAVGIRNSFQKAGRRGHLSSAMRSADDEAPPSFYIVDPLRSDYPTAQRPTYPTLLMIPINRTVDPRLSLLDSRDPRTSGSKSLMTYVRSA